MRLNFSVLFDMISLNSIGFVWIFIVPSSECLWSWSDSRQEVKNIYMFQIILKNIAMVFYQPYYVFVAPCISLIKIAASNENIECFREYFAVGYRPPDPSFFKSSCTGQDKK
jgi:hypothetical protein